MRDMAFGSPKIPERMDKLLPTRKPTWGLETPNMNSEESKEKEKIKATWLGHACFLVELPVRSRTSLSGTASGDVVIVPKRGARILFDPVFSSRCSPSQFVGPKRYTRTLSLFFFVYI